MRRTPLIISGPVPKGDNQEFGEYKPKVERLVSAQRTLVNTIFPKPSKHSLQEGDTEKAGFKLLQAHKGLAQVQTPDQIAQRGREIRACC
jgi:preprotein translocase subunit SecA